jgi:hypothetical protein
MKIATTSKQSAEEKLSKKREKGIDNMILKFTY